MAATGAGVGTGNYSIVMVVISFGTPRYWGLLAQMQATAQDHGCETDCVKLEQEFGWQRACQLKPNFIIGKLEHHKKPVLWVDADATIHKPLDGLHNIDCDIGLYRRRGYEVLSGSLLVNNTQAARNLLEEWRAICQREPMTWDQKCLAKALARVKCRVYQLPWQYCWIKGATDYGNEQDAIIIHHQASRTYRNAH